MAEKLLKCMMQQVPLLDLERNLNLIDVIRVSLSDLISPFHCLSVGATHSLGDKTRGRPRKQR